MNQPAIFDTDIRALQEWLRTAWQQLGDPSLTAFTRRELRNQMKQCSADLKRSFKWWRANRSRSGIRPHLQQARASHPGLMPAAARIPASHAGPRRPAGLWSTARRDRRCNRDESRCNHGGTGRAARRLVASAQNPAPSAFTVISPIFGQLVTFSMPAQFRRRCREHQRTELYPRGRLEGRDGQELDPDDHGDRCQGGRRQPKVSPENVAGSIVGGFKSACPDSFTAQGFGPAKFGEQDAYVAVASCGRVESSADKHSETALIVAVKGSADYYTLQWAERAPAAGKGPIDETKWLARLRQLQPIRLCPIVPGERAPYPSCAGKK